MLTLCVVEHGGSVQCHLRDFIRNAPAHSLYKGGPRDAPRRRLARRPALLRSRVGPGDHHLHRDEQDKRHRHQ